MCVCVFFVIMYFFLSWNFRLQFQSYFFSLNPTLLHTSACLPFTFFPHFLFNEQPVAPCLLSLMWSARNKIAGEWSQTEAYKHTHTHTPCLPCGFPLSIWLGQCVCKTLRINEHSYIRWQLARYDKKKITQVLLSNYLSRVYAHLGPTPIHQITEFRQDWKQLETKTPRWYCHSNYLYNLRRLKKPSHPAILPPSRNYLLGEWPLELNTSESSWLHIPALNITKAERGRLPSKKKRLETILKHQNQSFQSHQQNTATNNTLKWHHAWVMLCCKSTYLKRRS